MSIDRLPPARAGDKILGRLAHLLLCATTLAAQPLARIVPLGVPLPPALGAHRASLPPCVAGEAIACRENVSLAAFRVEVTMPAGVLDYFPAGFIPIAIESETAPGAIAPQTPEGFPRAHLRRFDRSGNPDPRAVTIPLAPLLPLEIWKRNRHQSAANELASPDILALADPR